MASETWICPTCSQSISSKYCPTCGEAQHSAHSLTFGGIAEQAFEAFSHADGRLWRSFGALLMRPGALTESYLNGQRQVYLGPFQIFLVANLVFILVQTLMGIHVFASALDSQVHQQAYRALAQNMLTDRLATLHDDQPTFAVAFDRAAALNAKSLVILMTPPFAFLSALLFGRSKRPIGAHLVFALHFFAFLLLLVCVVLVAERGLSGLAPGLSPAARDAIGGYAELVTAALYLFLAAGRVFPGAWWVRVLQVFALVIGAGFVWIGYRFVVFAVTLYTTA